MTCQVCKKPIKGREKIVPILRGGSVHTGCSAYSGGYLRYTRRIL